jgi:hypothetical protein
MDDSQVLKFISGALAARRDETKLVQEYGDLIKNDFAEFAKAEDAMSDDAGMLRKLEDIGQQFKLIATFPTIYGRRLGAVGGGFSSGKSLFINSFMKTNDAKLKIDVEPTTAIPTYVTYSEEQATVSGHSYCGGKFEIPHEIFTELDHSFLKKLPFYLKDIIPYITVSCPMDKQYFANICLIDTPGYDAPDTGYTNNDYKTASEQIQSADFLIWCINLQNGPIPNNDIKFLKQLRDEGKLKELYIVANKADRRTSEEIQDLLNKTEKYIGTKNYIGMCAYSAKFAKMYGDPRKMGLYEFLANRNIQSRTFVELNKGINEVFDAYKIALENQKKDYESNLKLINQNENKWTAIDVNIDNPELEKLRKCFDTSKIAGHLRKCEELRGKFHSIIARLENVEKHTHISTLQQLEYYLSELKQESSFSQKTKDLFDAEICMLKMIYSSDFEGSDFTLIIKLCGSDSAKMEKFSSIIITYLTAHLKYKKSNQADAERILEEKVCNEIAQLSEDIVNKNTSENATFNGLQFSKNLLSNDVFSKAKKDIETVANIQKVFYRIYKANGGKS